MPDSKVSILPTVALPLTGGELFYVDSGLADAKVTSAQISSVTASVNVQSGTSYTLQASDAGQIVSLSNAAAITLTLPNSFPVGFNCMVQQEGAGQITFTPASGATMAGISSATQTVGQYASAFLYVRTNSGTNAAWRISGGII